MKAIILIIMLTIFLINGMQNSLCEEIVSGSGEMGQFGPKLSQKELERISRLSTPELADMLRNGDTMHKFAALRYLTEDSKWRENFDLLLQIASEKSGNIIVEGLVIPQKLSDSEEDKKLVDKFLDFLDGQLKEEKPGVSGEQVVRSIGQTVRKDDQIEVPYGNTRVLDILISCLNSEDWKVRRAGVRWLGNVGANDLAKVDDIATILEAQIAKEEASQEKEEIKEEMKNRIQSALQWLRKTLKNKIERLERIVMRLEKY